VNRIFINTHNFPNSKDGIGFVLVPIGIEGKIAKDAECNNEDHFFP
jgi:hypothetical protein